MPGWNVPGVTPKAGTQVGGNPQLSTTPTGNFGPPQSAPAPSAPSGGGGSQQVGGGSEINFDFEKWRTEQVKQAAEQAYLTAKAQNDTEETAIHKAVAEANAAYQRAQVELEQRRVLQTGTKAALDIAGQRAEAYNTGMKEFESTGVATGGRISGLAALRQPLSPALYAGLLGLPETDPRAGTIAAAANQLFAGSQQTPSVATGAAPATTPAAPQPASPATPPPPMQSPLTRQTAANIPQFMRAMAQ